MKKNKDIELEESLLKNFQVYNNNIPESNDCTEVPVTDANELLTEIANYASKVRTEAILGRKYITGFICKDGTEIVLTDLIK